MTVVLLVQVGLAGVSLELARRLLDGRKPDWSLAVIATAAVLASLWTARGHRHLQTVGTAFAVAAAIVAPWWVLPAVAFGPALLEGWRRGVPRHVKVFNGSNALMAVSLAAVAANVTLGGTSTATLAVAGLVAGIVFISANWTPQLLVGGLITGQWKLDHGTLKAFFYELGLGSAGITIAVLSETTPQAAVFAIAPLLLLSRLLEVPHLESRAMATERGLGQLVEERDVERRRIADRVHDDAVQRLAALQMELELLRLSDDFASPQALDQLDLSAQQMMTSMRGLLMTLHPALLESEGLEAAVKVLIRELRTDDRTVTARISLTRFDPVLEHSVYRTVEDVLFLLKAGTGPITVEIEERNRELLASITGAFGLVRAAAEELARDTRALVAKARIEALGGTFAVHGHDQGCIVVFALSTDG